MSQNDMVIDNQNFPSFRADLNNALQSLASLSGGATAPSPVYDNMLWYDTATYTLKIDSNSTWAPVAFLNQSTNEFSLFDDTKVVNSSGTQTGIIGDQAGSVWKAGTSTKESLVSPAKIKSSVYPSESLSETGHITLGNVKQQWGRVLVTGQENTPFSITFDTTYPSTPWVITTTIEYTGPASPAGFELYEAVIITKSNTGFTGGLASVTSSLYSPVYINYLAIGPA